ncbi:uncharacterized protein LOC122374056 [Amphibalanus amphitrite]|uniref:uncharacterized protein LOC122374056 n=1 Tax=Amphibalanus amphitrite TaxID=1232801 RepID=UPI001C911D1C|nr:uncharacterized protein LOC122374056 [Amphibalanus amphitrite]
MSSWSVLGLLAGAARPAALLLGLLAAVRVSGASHLETTVLLRDLDFLDKLTNPCQITNTGRPLPTSRRQEGRDSELQIELRLASSLARFVREASGVPECTGMSLQSQPSISSLSGRTRHEAMPEMYRVFLIETAHLYLMAQEIRESHQTCGNESRGLVDELFSLAGHLQNILCVISESVHRPDLETVLNSVPDLGLSKYRNCHRRLMRNCLVLENTSAMLSLSLQYMSEQRAAQSNDIRPRLMVVG